MLDDADRIWNRACDPFADYPNAGDRALQALLRVHGQLMNGGLVSALEYHTPDEMARAVSALRYFRLDGPADALEQAFDTAFEGRRLIDPEDRGDHLDALDEGTHERLQQAEDDYYAAVPRDHVLEAAFRDRLRESPGDFAALDDAS